jgi:hypothetical protein
MPDIVTFDPVNLIIEEISQSPAPETELDVIEIYSEWKAWLVADSTRLKFLPAFSLFGGDPTTAGQTAPTFFFLENGWRFRPANYSHQVTLNGNLYVEGGGRIDVPTVGGFQVNVRQNFTVLQIDATSTTDPNIAAILAMVTELWARMGLDESNPVTFTDTGISFGGVNINITGPQYNKTVQRQP